MFDPIGFENRLARGSTEVPLPRGCASALAGTLFVLWAIGVIVLVFVRP
jgi:hypothetical protein